VVVFGLVACGTPAAQSVARVDNVTLSRQELDARIDRIAQGQQAQGPGGPSRLDIEKQVVDLFVTQNLMLSVARQKGVAVSDSEIDTQIDQFRQQIAGSGAGNFDEVVQQQLGFAGGDSSEFRQFASFVIAQQKLAETLVTSDTIRQQVTDQVMAEASQQVKKGTVAHILITVPEGADAATDAAAKAKAEDVIARLDKGEDFGALAKELSEDPGSKDNGGVYENVKQGDFVPEFDKAMFEDLQPGETTKEPVKTQFGYHVIKLIDRSEGPAMTEEEAKQVIEQQIGQQLQQERGMALQQLLADERTKAKAEGRLEEPTYPEPTPLPQPPAQQQPEQPTAPADTQSQPPTTAPTPAS
jgi:parvulin-like peptidyl-prolyl isomerase